MPKTLSMESAAAEILGIARNSSKIVFVSGNFNVVHPGHLRLLKFARECGDFLVVGVNNQNPASLTVPSEMRLEGVRAISLIDHAVLLDESPSRFIARLKPAVVVKGKEFEFRKNPEQDSVNAYGGKLLFGSGEVSFSSLDLLQREYFGTNFSTIHKPRDFPKRHSFKVAELKDALARIHGLRVLVIGDLIVDEYINCDPLGMSQEDPTIVVTPIEKKRFVGGAGIVAAHARGLGAQVQFISVSGDDEIAKFAAGMLGDYGVNSTIIPDDSRPTTLKQRFRADGKTLLRVSHLRQHDISADVFQQILQAAIQHVAQADLVIFADFNYGCLPQALVDKLVEEAARHTVPMVADSQASSQVSDISRFPGMMLITPTEREARMALRDPNSGLAVLAEALRKKARAQNVVITLGSEGMLVHAKGAADWETDNLPAFNSSPKDAAGAGDSFLTCAAMGLCAGVDIWQSVYLGSIASACQVSRVGNSPLTQADLITEIDAP